MMNIYICINIVVFEYYILKLMISFTMMNIYICINIVVFEY